MSAFCGVYQLDGQPVALDELNRVSDKLALWKPDKTFQWVQPNLGVTQWLYYNTPESVHATFPTTNHSECYVVASNTRLDNRAELAEKFNLLSAETKNRSDEDFLLLAYNKWGEDCSRYLLGDFAFVIWDAKKQQLFLTRDQVGYCKSIDYYYLPNKQFIFGSNIRPIYEHQNVSIELNEFEATRHLLMLQPDATQTFYKNIFRLPAGHHLIVNKQGLKVKKYRDESQPKKIRYKTDEEYIEHFNDLFFESVRCRLRSYSKIGSHLSGGLDSSSVSAVAAKLLQETNQTINCYGAVPPAGLDLKVFNPRWTADDGSLMKLVADKYPNIVLTKVIDNSSSVFNHLSRYLPYAEVPSRTSYNRLWIEKILETCAEKNIRTLLHGSCGNFTVSWNGPAARSLRSGAKSLLKQLLSSIEVNVNFLDRGKSQGKGNFAHPQLIKDHGLFIQAQAQSLHKKSTERLSYLVQFADCARTKAVYEALFGIESRDPTSDWRILKFCTAIPDTQFYRGSERRRLIRSAMVNKLPDAIRQRCTIGLQSADWYYKFDAEKKNFMSLIDAIDSQKYLQKYVDVEKLRSALNAWPKQISDDKLMILVGVYCNQMVDTFNIVYFIKHVFENRRDR